MVAAKPLRRPDAARRDQPACTGPRPARPDRVKALRETLAELGLRMEAPTRTCLRSSCNGAAAVAGRPRSGWCRCWCCGRWRARSTRRTPAATTRWRLKPTSTSRRRSGATRTWSFTACCGDCAQTADQWPAPSGSGSHSSSPGSARAARPPSGGPRRRSGWRCCGRRSTTWRDGWGRASTARSPGHRGRAVRADRRVPGRRPGPHLGAGRRLLQLRGGAAPAGRRARPAVWRLGDRIRVQLVGADAGELRIELVPVADAGSHRGAKPSPKGRARGDKRLRNLSLMRRAGGSGSPLATWPRLPLSDSPPPLTSHLTPITFHLSLITYH